DGGNLELFVGLGSGPGLQVKNAFFTTNHDVGIEDYCHWSAGGLRILRARCRSRRHAFASSGNKAVSANTSAKSRPRQTFSFSGLRRAKGEPFLTNTKVTFW